MDFFGNMHTKMLAFVKACFILAIAGKFFVSFVIQSFLFAYQISLLAF